MAKSQSSIDKRNTANEKLVFVIHQGNRVLIAVLSFIGLMLDGYSLSDGCFGCSIILWVWLPEFDKLEETCFCRKKNNQPRHDNKTE